MFYIVGFNESVLEILDSEDGVVDSISYSEFFDNYSRIKPYLLSNFYLMEGVDSVFDVFDRKNIKTPPLQVLFSKLGIKTQSDYYSILHTNTVTEYRTSAVNIELRSYSFVVNMHRYNYKVDAIAVQDKLLYYALNNSYSDKNITPVEAQIMFDYMSDYIKKFGTGLVFSLDYLANNCSYTIKDDCYVFRCCTQALAKLFMFALVAQKTGYLSNLNVIVYANSIFRGLRQDLGRIISVNLDGNIVTVKFEHFRDEVFLTKKKVLSRGSLK